MTTDDLDPKSDRVSSPEDRARLVAETLAHAVAQEAQYSQRVPVAVRGGGGRTAAALVLFALAAVIGVAPPAWLSGAPPRVVPSQSREEGAVAALYIPAQAVEAHRTRTGTLPATLEETGVVVPGVRFVRSNNRVYQLVTAQPGGTALVYDSSRPDPRFTQMGDGWFQEDGS